MDNRQWQQQLTRESLLLLSSRIMTSLPFSSSLLTLSLLITPPSAPDLALRDFSIPFSWSLFIPYPMSFSVHPAAETHYLPIHHFLCACLFACLCLCKYVGLYICLFQPLLLKNVTSEILSKLSKCLHYRPHVHCVYVQLPSV